METNPNHEHPHDARVRVADLISDIREVLAEPDPAASAADLRELLRLLADAAAEAIAGPVMAIDVMPGDVLLLDGSTVTVTSAPRPGAYRIGEARQQGVALDWRAGSQRGVTFRRADELLCRLPRRDGPRVTAPLRPTSATGGGSCPAPGGAR